jgi:hypothetical protein
MKKPTVDLINYENMLIDGNGYKLLRFAYCKKNTDDNEMEYYLSGLSSLAEPENWTTLGSKYSYDILDNYIKNTFEKAFDDHQINFSETKDYCSFNTGLLTPNGEDILCLFNQFSMSDRFLWHLFDFKRESDVLVMNHFSSTAPVPMYFNNKTDLYFDPNLEIVKNFDHILEDHPERFPADLISKGNTYVANLLTSSLDLTIKRCRRNYRIAVPQYYNKHITYLLPVTLGDSLMALAVEYINGRYRANTIFTLDMAYKNARLLMKPEADWLQIKK